MRDNGVVEDFESAVYRRDGTVIWITETCREVRTSTGRLLYYEGTVEDITGRKRREEELRAAKVAAETANRAKTEFLATMSHELRTPLNAVMGFAELIHKESLGAVSVPAYRDYAGNIHASGQHLLAVINDILDFVKAESGSMALEIGTVDLSYLSASVIRLLKNQAKTAGVDLIDRMPDGAVPCQGDERRLRQVLINLAGNAIKFTPAGGSVTITGTRAADGQARLEVRDTGIGMSAKDLAHVGEPFYQADSKLDRKYEGTGLGLAICKRLVKLHGGSMTIDSAPGKGTVIAVLLPGGLAQPTLL
jgi:signal transduction histidine kinase